MKSCFDVTDAIFVPRFRIVDIKLTKIFIWVQTDLVLDSCGTFYLKIQIFSWKCYIIWDAIIYTKNFKKNLHPTFTIYTNWTFPWHFSTNFSANTFKFNLWYFGVHCNGQFQQKYKLCKQNHCQNFFCHVKSHTCATR